MKSELDELGKKLNNFIQGVEKYHNMKYGSKLEEPTENYETDFDQMLSEINDLSSKI